VGRIVAPIAAVLLALSLAISWWSGHPTLDGKHFDRKTANIGLISADQCNYADGEENECKHLSVGGSLAINKFIELGLIGVLALSLLLLALTGKKGFAKVVMVAAAAAAVMSIILLILGPDLKTGKSESMPIGVGFIVFALGTGLAIATGVIAMLPARPSMRMPLSASGFPAPLSSSPFPAPGGFDVQALFAEEALHPSSHNPGPMMGRPQGPGGALPGPAGPLVPPSGPQPLFQSAPQLRPLYEVNGGGFPPPGQPTFPTRPPTPMPHTAVNAAFGLDLPPLPVPPPLEPMAPRLPPPMRGKPPSIAPPLPGKRPPPPMSKPPPLGSPTRMSAVVPPPSSPTKLSAVVPPPTPLPPISRPPIDEPENADDLLQTSDYEKALGVDSVEASLAFDTATAENETKAFSNDERTDVGSANVDDRETAARQKSEPTSEHQSEARSSMTEVELVNRPSVSQTDVEIGEPAPPPEPELERPISTAPESLPPPTEMLSQGPSPACPQCEAPMAWVEQHLRFFCKSCRMYF